MEKAHALSSKVHAAKNPLLIAGIIFVAFNLRPAITSVGPLISFIREDTGMSNSLAGFITTLPLLAFAFLSPLAPKISQKIGKEATILTALIFLGIGLFIRSSGMVFTLFLGTAIIGLGVAICNVILPGIVKQSFPTKIGLMTGMYTVSMGAMAGIAPGISVPLADSFYLGWQGSLRIWLILVIPALFIWTLQSKRKENHLNSSFHMKAPHSSMLRSGLAWQVTLFMGLQSTIYFCFITWLPEMLYSHGISISTAGWMVSILQFSGIPANFIIPIIADRVATQKGIVIAIGVLCMSGLVGLIIGGHILLLTLAIISIGIGTGAAISLALTLMVLRAANAEQAANLSAMSQSIGYLLAAIGPILLGFIFDIFHSWSAALLLLMAITVIMTLAGIGAGGNQYVLDEDSNEQ